MTWNTQKALAGPRTWRPTSAWQVFSSGTMRPMLRREVGFAEGAAVDEAQHHDARLGMDDLGREAGLEGGNAKPRARGRGRRDGRECRRRSARRISRRPSSATKERLVRPPLSGCSVTGAPPARQARELALKVVLSHRACLPDTIIPRKGRARYPRRFQGGTPCPTPASPTPSPAATPFSAC